MLRGTRAVLLATLLAQAAACGPASPPEASAETAGATFAAAQEIDWKAVDTAMGRTGAI